METTIEIHPEVNPQEFSNLKQLDQSTRANFRNSPILEAKGLQKAYDKNIVLPGLNFRIDDLVGVSEIVGILGPSGCGKSTILKLIAGLEEPTQGSLEAFGQTVHGPSQDRGMIFQKYSSFPFLTVVENVAYPLIHVKKLKVSEAMDIASHWVDKMYLTKAAGKYPTQLSGGMQQRVAIARTLAMKARIILMDEPFGALDRKIRWEMQDLMAEITFFQPEYEFSVLLVTHDIPEAVFLADRIWVIHKGNLVVEEFIDRPSEPARKAQSRPDFLDRVNFFNEKLDGLSLT